ncbi:MAG: pilus assembly protein N-terminal domain-containing protein [Limnochordia bacterium]|jgi:pilus assembly protein CpaC|nr:pilus assembly protein N-terminal domain-containing protein [Limnochordia bacterium]MDD2629116.1 pilus assembly protein N-terminal domain-containing protein [Limnochordia bacterium]MDD4517282.1 pilus assembly protein N-terminal domain-containing protein [Limnochordia bacterium]
MRKLIQAIIVGLLVVGLVSLCSGEVISVAEHCSLVIPGSRLERVAVGNPRVADVQLISSTEFLVNGKSPGRTNILVWDEDEVREYTVYVTTNDEQLPEEWFEEVGQQLHRWGIDLRKVGPVAILEGETATAAQLAAAEHITSRLFDDVASLVRLSTDETPVFDDYSQIQLITYIVELSEGSLRTLGIDWQRTIASDEFGLLNLASVAQLSALINKIEMMEQTGKASILANPVLLVTSGKPARFLAGGQVPIPVESGENLQIQWKEYGVSVQVTARIEEDTIVIKIEPEVSSLDWANAVNTKGGTIPALRTRSLYTEVRMLPHETLVLGGLFIQEEAKSHDKVPLLGSLPLLGGLFRTSSIEKRNTELVILLSAFPKTKGLGRVSSLD